MRSIKMQIVRMPLCWVLGVFLLGSAAVAQAAVATIAFELIENQRRLLVLSEASVQIRGEARRAGHYLFVRNQHLVRELVHEVQSGSAGTVSSRYRDFVRAAELAVRAEGDRLVLRAALRALLQPGLLQGTDRYDVQRRLTAIGDIRRRFGADVDDGVLQSGAISAKSPRPLWDAYVRGLMNDISPERVIARLDDEIFAAFPDTTDHSEAAARARFLEWDGTELPERSVLLTFDDGPHATNTPRVLDILQAHGVHAIFYMVGRNLGTLHDGKPLPGANADIVRRMVAEGHAVGNHSYTHPILPKLDNAHLKREVEDTQRLIEALAPPGPSRTATMRPPFGARNDRVLAEIDSHRLRSVMWNVDSLDWADPIPESIVRRVVREVEKEGGGIILMHDIHARTADALARIIVALKQRGYVFLRWDGSRLTREAPVQVKRQ
jgi:peptidoglycan/xylan/chitin deacetylase (PgdA/CDA1 family)